MNHGARLLWKDLRDAYRETPWAFYTLGACLLIYVTTWLAVQLGF